MSGGARFEEALLQGRVLQGADRRGADLRHVNLRFAQLEGAFFDQRTRFPPDFDPDWAGMQLSIPPHSSGDPSQSVLNGPGQVESNA